MPKLLDNIKEKAIEEARREMLSDGYRAMTIRRVAKELGIATGTLYNYFPSKEYLAAGVMLEDWQAQIQTFEEEPGKDDPSVVIRRLFEMVSDFTSRDEKIGLHPSWLNWCCVSARMAIPVTRILKKQ